MLPLNISSSLHPFRPCLGFKICLHFYILEQFFVSSYIYV